MKITTSNYEEKVTKNFTLQYIYDLLIEENNFTYISLIGMLPCIKEIYVNNYSYDSNRLEISFTTCDDVLEIYDNKLCDLFYNLFDL